MDDFQILSFIMDAPVLIKVLCSLAVILIFNHLFKNLIISVISGTFILALWSGHSFRSVGLISLQRIASLDLLFLLLTIAQVIIFSTQMSETGMIRDLVGVVQSGTTKRFSVAMLPAMIGLLPMPGGALFSAPLVDDCDPENSLQSVQKTRINYWFRHIWEYWWPIYPGVLLAIEITRLPIWQFILLQFPLSLLSVIAGYFFFLRKVENIPYTAEKKNSLLKTQPVRKFIFRFFEIFYPVIAIIVITVFIRIFFPAVAGLNKYIPMCIAILIATVLLQVLRPLSGSTWKKIIFSKRTLLLVLLVAAVRLYGAFIEAELPEGISLVTKMRMELEVIGIPLIVIIVLIPFVAGLSSGLAVGFVGASFPIVINIIGAEPQLGVHLATTLLAFASGYMGMMLSPVHVCFIVTNEYFKTQLIKSMVGLLKPASVVLLGASGLYLLIRYVLF